MKNDEIFEYGWWDDRYDFGNYIRDHELFAKKVPRYTNPFVCGDFYKWDIHNKISGLIKDYGFEDLSEEYLQLKFDEIIEMLDIAYNTGYEYDWFLLKNDVVKYFKKYNLYSSDNRKKCEHAHWRSKLVNGCKGIAAKKDISRYDQFSCDKILSVWYNGKWHDSTYHTEDSWHEYPIAYRNIPYKNGDSDEWGFCQEIYNYQKVKNYLAQTVLF
jgi:hypothetical protein